MFLLVPLLFSQAAFAAHIPFPRVESELQVFDLSVADFQAKAAEAPGTAHDDEWTKRRLTQMFEIDQYMRTMSDVLPRNYDAEETAAFWQEYGTRWSAIDRSNTQELQSMLEKGGWPVISKFGKKADNEAWLLLQHADRDVDFQKKMLPVLEKLAQQGESSPSNFAYLYDRIHSIGEKSPQRYGTQGHCTGPGRWEPWPIEDPSALDARRASMGLKPMAEYLKVFETICH
jgi:hypothetical protein